MRRSLIVALALIALWAAGLALLGPARLSAAAPSLKLLVPAEPQPAGAPIAVQVLASGVSDLAAFEFDLTFDPGLVRVSGISAGSFFGAEQACPDAETRCAILLGPVAEESAGRASVGAVSYGQAPGASGEGVVAVLYLEPTGRGGSTPLGLAAALIADTKARAATPVVAGGTLQIEAGPENGLFLPLLRK